MALRRQRMHSTGVSNVDYRVKEDWKLRRTLRPELHQSKYQYHEEQMGLRLPLSPPVDLTRTQPSMSQEKFYKTAGKPIRTHPELASLNTSPLDGMNLFVGGDNDPFIYKAHKGLKKASTTALDSSSRRKKLPKYYSTKDIEHKKAIQETQLVHIQHDETLEGKIDLAKVVDIRRTIRRRYANRSNFRTIFNQWDRDSLGVIRTDDVHFMVNQLGIPINKDEARVLVASANQSDSGALNLDEFLQLIFDDSDKLNVDLSVMKAVEATSPKVEPQQYSESMLADLHELAVNQHTKQLQEQLKLHIKERVSDVTGQMLRNDKTRSGVVNFGSFCEVMNNLSLPHSISNEKLWNLLYTEAGGKEDGLKYKDFIKQIEKFSPDSDALDKFQETASPPQNPLLTQMSADSLLQAWKTDSGPVILDPQRVPVNKIESILFRSRRICGFLKEKFPDESAFKTALEKKATDGIITQEKLREFVKETTSEDPKFQVTMNEMDNFLSRYVYNKQGETGIETVAFNLFSDDVRADTALQRRIRAIPPTKKPMPPEEDVSKPQLKRILQGLDEKIFTQGSQKSYKAFKTFDGDNDGYVDLEDLKQGLTAFNIPHSEAEARALMQMLDESGKGYVEYRDFARVVKPNTVFHSSLEEKPPKHSNYVQPSKEFLETQLARAKVVDKAYEELRTQYKPQDGNFGLKPATRFGHTPEHKNTFLSFVPPDDAGMYLDEKARLTGKNTDPINIGNLDKESKLLVQEAKTKRIRNTLTNFHQRISQQDEKLTKMDESKVGHKAAFREQYEKVNFT